MYESCRPSFFLHSLIFPDAAKHPGLPLHAPQSYLHMPSKSDAPRHSTHVLAILMVCQKYGCRISACDSPDKGIGAASTHTQIKLAWCDHTLGQCVIAMGLLAHC